MTTDGRPEQFVVIYRPGPAWRAGRRVTEQDLGPHREFVRGLFEEGRVALAGAFLDDSGGMAVLSAQDRAEAERTLASDPAVTSGVMIGELRPYLLLFPPDRTTAGRRSRVR